MAPRTLLDAALAAHLEGPVGIAVASRDDQHVPDLVQGLGCRVHADGQVTVLVSRPQAAGVLACLAAGAPLAVTFSVPTTTRTVQLKAARARVAAPRKADLAAVARYRRALEAELARVGYPPAFTRAMLTADDAELAAVTFAPDAAFDQTPGVGAGRCLAQGGGAP